MARHRPLLVLLLALAAPSPSPLGALQPPPRLAELIGERLEFAVRWGVLPAAEAQLEVEAAGDGRVTLRATARSLPWVDVIYPVRDLAESTVALPAARAVRYYKHQQEGRRRTREVEVQFDLEAGRATYRRDEEEPRSLEVPPDVLDPLASFYAYRIRDLPADEAAELPVSDGKRLVRGTVRVVGRETLETPAGVFETVIIEPELEGVGGIFRKSPGARVLIWLTDDRWRRPVRLQSEVSVGKFTADLVRVEHPAAGLGGPAAD